ncbi:MAG: GNAT family N-acetyltransferase [Anaerolineae bacterium]|jgi:GNAT superfamily N-acetyltransferase|nr:GNAT family N-acetyltransferase [Anaerolineae bacterium]
MEIKILSASEIKMRFTQFSDLLIDVVNGGGAVSFLPPLARETADQFWERVIDDVATGHKILLAAMIDDQVVGSVQLALMQMPNQVYRAEVQKLLVLNAYRQRGIGQALMVKLEEVALEVGRTLLILDTLQGDSGERLYRRLGWTELGVIPKFALIDEHTLAATVFFYKHLVG